MINPTELETRGERSQPYRPTVLDGGAMNIDLKRLTETMAMLENYVDSLLAAEGPPAMDPWIDDEDLATRMSCL